MKTATTKTPRQRRKAAARYLVLWSLLLLPSARVAADEPAFRSGATALEVGHWIEVRGRAEASGAFTAERAELLPPQKCEVLIGTVPRDETDPERFRLLGQPVAVSEKTEWDNGLEPGSMAGRRIKVEGRYRGPWKLSAREISPRGGGRDRLGGRVEEVRWTRRGVEVWIMGRRVFLPHEVHLEHDVPLAQIAFGPPPENPGPRPLRRAADEDDLFGQGLELGDDVRLSGQLELRSTSEDNYDLDEGDEEDRIDTESSLRVRLDWTPKDAVTAVAELRHRQRHRDDDEDGTFTDGETRLGEAYVFLEDPFGVGLGLQVGRQDFDDSREWLYDQNLDALRLTGSWPGLAFELSASTTLSDGRRRDEASTNWMFYLSNNDHRRHLAAYVIHREIDAEIRESPTHVGLRALGRWLGRHRSWLEIAHLGGRREGARLAAWGLDLGTTWSPAAGPFYFTAGYAFGSGGDGRGATDRTFRQTGFQDNNGKLGGVTSLRYYGELVDPELANLHVATAGVGARVARKTSIDLIFHHYRQDAARPELIDAELDRRPDGVHRDLGWEVDLVVGARRWASWDLELVGAYFAPGAAFEDRDDAFLGKLQVRYRF